MTRPATITTHHPAAPRVEEHSVSRPAAPPVEERSA
jgi:hypothetical protein